MEDTNKTRPSKPTWSKLIWTHRGHWCSMPRACTCVCQVFWVNMVASSLEILWDSWVWELVGLCLPCLLWRSFSSIYFFNFNVLVLFYLLYHIHHITSHHINHIISHHINHITSYHYPREICLFSMRYRKTVDPDERGRGEEETKGKL